MATVPRTAKVKIPTLDAKNAARMGHPLSLNIPLYFIFPPRMVTEALGSVIDCASGVRVCLTGGLSGSGWLLGPSECHMYWSLPKVTREIGPLKDLCGVLVSSKAMRTWCGLD